MIAPLPRRAWLAGAASGAAALGAAGAGLWLWRGARASAAQADRLARRFPASTQTHRFSITLGAPVAALPGEAVNRRVLGSNVQWVDGGDDMLGADDRFQPQMLALARQLGPTVLRYPGGAQSDAYRWERGIGEMSRRGPNDHVNAKRQQPTRMGTQEFLELCEATGAVPLVTVNMVTGTPDEAARWVHAVNVAGMSSRLTGRRLPRVQAWELGNEPYLKHEARPELDLPPLEFAARANRFTRAMRAADPAALRIGLPLSLDTRNGVPVTAYPGFARQVLGTLTEAIDFVSVHNAYMPFANDAEADAPAMYWGAMAATRTVQADLVAMRALLAEARPGAAALPLAVTEYHALFSLGRGASDEWVTTPAGALYVADALRLFAVTPEVQMANLWSLSGNWRFGAIHSGRYPRPVFEAMRLVGEALQGERLPAELQADTVATAGIGLVAAVPALSLVEALATRAPAVPDRRGNVLRVLLIHKDPSRHGSGRLLLRDTAPRAARITHLGCRDVFEAGDGPGVMQTREQVLEAGREIGFTLAPHSLALVTVELGA